MNKKLFGTLSNGEEVYIYSLVDGETRADVMDYGATILSLKPFGDVDVVGGFDRLECYIGDASYQGATIGRVANRIADASFAATCALKTSKSSSVNSDGNRSFTEVFPCWFRLIIASR